MKYDVFGIGSAIMDFLIQVHPNELLELDLKKGHFHLVDETKSKSVLDSIKKSEMKIAPGGSCANSLFGIAQLGGSVVFCGKVGKDEHGMIYEQQMVDCGVKSCIGKIDTHKTGHAITFITPDTERTFVVHLGASIKLEKEDVFFDDLKQSKVLHVEGYQLEDPSLRSVALHAMEFAKKNNAKVSIDLADPGIVNRNKEDMIKLVKDYADIVFANEDEAKALTGKDAIDALNEISTMAEIAIVKIGKKGSLIKKGSELYEIKPHTVKPLDTTGAGDMYAAGFLYGLTHDLNLQQSGDLGSYLAAKVVGQIGARLESIDPSILKKIKDVN
jgi:sugar/nucleoside kinase (ribokinase family)